MNTIDEMITVLKAFKEGKTIEFRRMEGIGNTKWEKTNSPIWEWARYEYRVKPEPKYVPYNSVSEVDRSKWVKRKDTTILRAIIKIDTSAKNCVYIEGSNWYSLKEFFEIFEYEDGTPCGKMEDK